MSKKSNVARSWRVSALAALFLFAAPSAFAAPVGIGFKGLLEDGGKFLGYIIYGDQDVDSITPATPTGVDGRGRYTGGFWQVDVKGGSTTVDASMSNLTGGRAPVETVQSAALISLLTLGPESGELPRLELLFEARPGYDADVQPTVLDIAGFYASFTDGVHVAFSRYQDRFGVSSNVVGDSIEIFDATHLLPTTTVPLPAPLALLAAACGLLAPLGARRKPGRAHA